MGMVSRLRSKSSLDHKGRTEGLPPIQSIIDACPSNIAVINGKGIILYVNRGWRRLAYWHRKRDKSCGVGINYLDLCWESGRQRVSQASAIARAIEHLWKGPPQSLSPLHTCRMFSKDQWFSVRGIRCHEPGSSQEPRLVLFHEKVKQTKQITEAIKDRDERLRDWMESAPFVPWEADARTLRMTYIGPQAKSLLGFSHEDWYRPDFWFSHIHPDDCRSIMAQYQGLGKKSSRREFQYRMIAKNGKVVWVRDTVTVVGKQGEPKVLRGFFSDISFEAELREGETLLRLLSESIDEVFWLESVNPARLLYISPAVEQIMGRETDKFYGDVGFWMTCIHEEDRHRVKEAYSNWLRGTSSEYKQEFRIVLPDGRIRWMSDHGALLYDRAGRAEFARGIAKDVTEQKQIEEALRRLSRQLISAQEDERRRISRELHDHVSQTLALLTVETEQLSRDQEITPNQRDLLADMQRRLRALSSDIHAMSYELHPAKLKHLGLVSAIRAMCRDVEKAGLHVDFTDHEVPRELSEDVALTIYRVMQEGLQNVSRHSGINHAEAELKKCPSGLTLRLLDKGKGFHSNMADVSEGLGLLSMRERMSSVGGTLVISSGPGKGTVIEAHIPLP